MSISYDVANNTITVTGYTEDSPCAFLDVWNADKAGTLSLAVRTGIDAVDPSPVNLARSLRSADEVLMGGAKQDLYILVTNWSNMSSATIRLIGTNENGGALTEDIVVTGNGTYYTSKLFKTLTQSQVIAFTKSDSGSFSYEVLQGQWGVVWKEAAAQFYFDAKIKIGDGSTATWFADTNKQILFYPMIDPNKPIYVAANATFKLGSVVDVNSKTTRNGCDIFDLATSSWGWVIDTAVGSTVNLYSCRLATLGKNGYIILAGAGNVWNCVCDYRVSLLLGAGSTINVFNLLALGGQTGIQSRSASATINKITALGTNYAYSFRYMDGGSATVVNVFARNILTTTVELMEITNTNCYVVDADVGTADWTITYSGTVTGTVVFRQYSFDLKVTDKDNNPISAASVTLRDKDGNQIFSVATDTNGNIATQIISRGYYDQAHGNTLQDYGPHTLTITKAGYQIYVKKFTLTGKTVWEIKLAKAVSILLAMGQPLLNLKASDPENSSVLAL